MPHIRCHYIDCVFLDDGYCSCRKIEIDPDLGCTTYSRMDDLELDEGDWEDIEEEFDGYEDVDLDDEEPDLWLDED